MTEPSKPGEAVDADGKPVFDPSKNVLDLVEAAIRRQDDLRNAEKELLESKVKGLKECMQAKFDSVAHELAEIEKGRLERKNDTTLALKDALGSASLLVKEQAAAAKEAILKSEANAGDQFKQQTATTNAQLQTIITRMDDLKERIAKVETEKQTKTEGRVDTRLNVGMVVSISLAAFSFLMLVIAAVAFFAAMNGAG